MKPPCFKFAGPDTLDGVLAAMAEHGDEARVLAGGQSLVPLMNLRMLRPAVLVSINNCVELDAIAVDDEKLTILAGARQWNVQTHPGIQADWPLLSHALRFVGGRSNRNRGTVCGSLAHADPLAEVPAAITALDGEMEIRGPDGTRRVAACNFYLGPLENCLAPEEVLVSVSMPRQSDRTYGQFDEMGNRKHGFALAGVAARLTLTDEGACQDVRIVVMGGHAVAQRVSEAEASLEGVKLEGRRIDEAASVFAAVVKMAGDFHADEHYRASLAGTLLKRNLERIQADFERDNRGVA
jgi:CO/xanthine dehydrogenase FAD-binding subunit